MDSRFDAGIGFSLAFLGRVFLPLPVSDTSEASGCDVEGSAPGEVSPGRIECAISGKDWGAGTADE